MVQTFIDNSLIQKIIQIQEESQVHVLMDRFKAHHLLNAHHELPLVFGWPSFLQSLNLNFLIETFPKFDSNHPLFNFLISSLSQNTSKELFFDLYDQVFIECLTQVKNLPQIDQTFLIQQIHKSRQLFSHSVAAKFFGPELNHYENLLIDDPYQTIHDLTLYLAWDRVCVNLAIIFEQPLPLKIQGGLDIIRDCLLESFQHITNQKRTSPGFFRLVEALYAYQLREENIQQPSESEWLILCQSASALRPRYIVGDVFYIDAAVVDSTEKEEQEKKSLLRVLTMDSPDKVQASFALANYMINQCKQVFPDWKYVLRSVEVVCFQEENHDFKVESILQI